MVPYTTGAGTFRAKKLRPLITTAAARLAQLPEVPTFAEKGISANGLNLIMGFLCAARSWPDGVRQHFGRTPSPRPGAIHRSSPKSRSIGLLSRL